MTALCWSFIELSFLQETTAGNSKEAGKFSSKKVPGANPPPKPAKEKPTKPKKEPAKAAKPIKPADPTNKTKVAGHQPGVIRGITYYKAGSVGDVKHSSSTKGKVDLWVAIRMKVIFSLTFHACFWNFEDVSQNLARTTNTFKAERADGQLDHSKLETQEERPASFQTKLMWQ